jgi:hypothetical protein
MDGTVWLTPCPMHIQRWKILNAGQCRGHETPIGVISELTPMKPRLSVSSLAFSLGAISVGPPFCPESLNVFEGERLVFPSRLFIIASSLSATWRSCPMRSTWRPIVVFIPAREPDYAATTTVPLARLTQGSTYPALFCSAVSPASTSI